MPKVLVLGCAGYISSTLVGRLLDEGYEVTGVDNFFYKNQIGIPKSTLFHKNFTFHPLDLEHVKWAKGEYPFNLTEFDWILPLQALVGAGIADKHPMLARSVNYHSVADMMAHIVDKNKVLYFNTNSGYGKGEDGVALTEDSPLKPVSLYGQTKIAAESVVLKYPQSYSLRLATVFGVSYRQRMDLLLNHFTSMVWFNKPLALFEPHFRRNFIHVFDVCEAVLHFMKYRPPFGVYNCGNNLTNITKYELAKLTYKVLGKSEQITTMAGKDPDSRDYLISNDKLYKVAGYQPFVSLEKGIQEVAKLCSLYPTYESMSHMANI